MYYLKELFRGNFGYSFLWNRPVLGLLIDRMQATLLLIFTGFIVGFTTHFPGDPWSAFLILVPQVRVLPGAPVIAGGWLNMAGFFCARGK
ncbi:MAG: hypothetical protein V3V52_10410 [Candidatus Adiutricales bacterium]